MILLPLLVALFVITLPPTQAEVHFENAELTQTRKLLTCPILNGYSSCSKSCKGRNVCKDGLEIGEISCPENAPFCDPDTLTCSKTSKCVPITTSCPNNITADLVNCHNFYYCDGHNLLQYSCTGDLKFDPFEKICKQTTNCLDYNDNALCENHKEEYIPYFGNNEQFVYCGPKNTPNLLYCPEYTIFNEGAKACQFSCKNLGLNPDPFNENGFYNCTKLQFTIQPKKGTCPGDFVFDRDLKKCVRPKLDDEVDGNVCGLHATKGVLEQCRIEYSSTGGGILDPFLFKMDLIVSCFVDSQPQVVYYDCGVNEEILKDCSGSGHKNGAIDGCTVGPCFNLIGNFTHISYDCRNLVK